jgi:hypothetical protein
MNVDIKNELYIRRLSQLKQNLYYKDSPYSNEEVLRYKLEAEKKYGNILMLPLDIPVIKDEKFVDWYWDNAQQVRKLTQDIASQRDDLASFKSIDVFNENSEWIIPSKSVWSRNICSNFHKLFPDIFDQLNEYFPYQFIGNFSLWSSIEYIGPHRDPAGFLDFPSSFRVMLYDENPNPTLFVQESPTNLSESVLKDVKFIPKLNDSNSFAWNNLRTMHGSNFNPNHRKILLIFHHCIVDWKKYFSLMDRSIAKYSDQCAKSNLSLKDFVY